MPYCPECSREYEAGVNECEECGIALEDGSPPETARSQTGLPAEGDNALVRLRTFSGATAQLDADLARNILGTAGIPCVLPGETSAELLPFLDVSLLVRQEDADRVAELLKSYLDAAEPLPPE